MDNFHIDMTSQGSLKAILEIVFARLGPKSGATHYAIREAVIGKDPKPVRMVFFSHYTPPGRDVLGDKQPFPFKMDAAGCADFAERWLKELDYGRQPDHDGDNGRGWRVYCEGWGHVDRDSYAIVAVAPAWAMYGK